MGDIVELRPSEALLTEDERRLVAALLDVRDVSPEQMQRNIKWLVFFGLAKDWTPGTMRRAMDEALHDRSSCTKDGN